MSITFKTKNISPEELQTACNLVNQGGQLSIVLTHSRLNETAFQVIALSENNVVGISCIKKYAQVAEIGYTAVEKDYRRQKISTRMTEILIDHAIKEKISILCGMVYASNQGNREKLEKLGFFEYSQYTSEISGKDLCWYCHPLLTTQSEAKHQMKKFLVERKRRLSTRS